jgi:hypothetical protein
MYNKGNDQEEFKKYIDENQALKDQLKHLSTLNNSLRHHIENEKEPKVIGSAINIEIDNTEFSHTHDKSCKVKNQIRKIEENICLGFRKSHKHYSPDTNEDLQKKMRVPVSPPVFSKRISEARGFHLLL